jgi:phospholipid/cholesterol/gamma-HCH transport system substrate-binding protein
MKNLMSSRFARRAGILAVAVVLVLVGLMFVRDARSTTVTVLFPSAEGLYPGDDVRVLGVPVGSIQSVDPVDAGVEVVLTVEDGQRIPAEARAAIVSPSLVSGRFVQLEPAYTRGPALEDGARIGLERTAVPVTFDEVKQELIDLTRALGPRGGGEGGSLNRAIVAIDESLGRGNSTELRRAIAGLRQSSAALSDPRSDLFATIKNLDVFTRALAVNDGAVRGFTTELQAVGQVLERNRTGLTTVLRLLARTLERTRSFLDANGTDITRAVRRVNLLSAAMADRSNELAGSLHVGTNALINLANIVEGSALKGRATLTGLDNVAQLLCGAILGAGGTAEQCRQVLQPLLEALGLGEFDQGSVPGFSVPEPGRGELPLPELGGAELDLLENLGGLLTGSQGAGR